MDTSVYYSTGISFILSYTHTPAEPPHDPSFITIPSTTTFTVMRSRGTFTDVSVIWQVTTPSADLDITPTNGTLNFAAGQTSASFQITALADDVSDVTYLTSLPL